MNDTERINRLYFRWRVSDDFPNVLISNPALVGLDMEYIEEHDLDYHVPMTQDALVNYNSIVFPTPTVIIEGFPRYQEDAPTSFVFSSPDNHNPTVYQVLLALNEIRGLGIFENPDLTITGFRHDHGNVWELMWAT